MRAIVACILRLSLVDASVTLRLVPETGRTSPHLAWGLGHALSYQGALPLDPLRSLLFKLARSFDREAAAPSSTAETIEYLRELLAGLSVEARLERLADGAAPLSRRRITGWPRRGQPEVGALFPFDPEVLGIRAGLRRLIKREPYSMREAKQEIDWLETQGLVTKVASAEDDVPIVFAACEPGLLAEAAAAEAGLAGPDRIHHTGWLGEMLGYPPCCVAAFSRCEMQDDDFLTRRLLPPLGVPPAQPETLWLTPPLAVISHAPCALGCDASVRLGARLLALLDTARPGFQDDWRRVARRVHVVDTEGRVLSLTLDQTTLDGARITGAITVHLVSDPGESPIAPAPALPGRTLAITAGNLECPGPDGFVAKLVADHRG